MLFQFQTIMLRCTHAYCVSHSECHRLTCTCTWQVYVPSLFLAFPGLVLCTMLTGGMYMCFYGWPCALELGLGLG